MFFQFFSDIFIKKINLVMNFLKEMKWRGMVHNTTPGLESKLNENRVLPMLVLTLPQTLYILVILFQ